MRLTSTISALLVISIPVFGQKPTETKWPTEFVSDRKPSILTHGDCLIKHGTVLTVTKGRYADTDVLVQHGKIAAIGKGLTAPSGMTVIDATGKFVMPGIVDAHSHRAEEEANEQTDAIVADVRMVDVLNPRDQGLYDALAAGATCALSLHGSANPIGGESYVIKTKYNTTVQDLLVPDAPRMIKFALGENVRWQGARFPVSRLGVEAVYRRAFNDARQYMKLWDTYYEKLKINRSTVPPRKDLRLETLADILRRRIWVHCHSYRADEMLMMLRLSKEFDFKLAALQHALEAYKIMPEIKAAGVGVSTFADLWSYKIEAFDAIPHNAAMCLKYGILTSVNTDSFSGVHPLHLDAAKMIRYGGLTEDEALRLITINPAAQLGVAHRLGSLEVGKDADIGIWDGYPLSVYSRCNTTLIEGEVYYQRRDTYGLSSSAIFKNELQTGLSYRRHLVIPSTGEIAIVGANVYPVSSPMIPSGTVLIKDGIVTLVGKDIAIPPSATVVHAERLCIFPGFINASSSIGINDIEEVQVTRDLGENGMFHPDLNAVTAINPASEHINITRAAGVTTALVRMSPPGSLIIGRSGVIALEGRTPELMSVSSHSILHVVFPEGSSSLYSSVNAITKDDDAKKIRDTETAARRKLKDMFDRATRYSQSTGDAENGVRDQAQLDAMVPFVTGKGYVAFDVNTERGIRDAIKFAQDWKLKPIIWGGAEAYKVTDLLKKENIPVVLMPPQGGCPGDYGVTNDYDPQDTTFVQGALLSKAGIKFCFGSFDSAMAKLLPLRAGIACAYGLPYDEALKSITTDASDILGLSNTIHGLDTGKMANLIITNGDPLEVTTDVLAEMIGGKPVSLASRHTRLYEQFKPLLSEIPKGK